MSDLNRRTSQTIDARRRPLAEAAVARQYRRQPGLRDRYGECGQAKCIQDTEYHLACLSAAVAFSSPALFTDYLAWTTAVLTVRGLARDDVQSNLVCLRDTLQEALPAEMASVVTPYVEAALQALPEATLAEEPTFLEGDDALSELARVYLQALLRGERQAASALILDAVRGGVAVSDLYLQVFQRCQREVGRLWQLGRITVAQEHYCSAAVQLVMSQLYPHFFALPRTGRRLVAASVAGELHEIGLRVVADLFEAEGWDTLYLGANLPPAGVVHALGEHRADLLLVSVTMPFHLRAAEELIAAVRSSEAGATVKVLVGGRPFNVVPELWRRLGADGHAPDAGAALEAANRLLGTREPQTRAARSGPAEPPSEAASHSGPHAVGTTAVYDEMSRLNSDLVTLQRELARKNAELERLNRRLTEADRRKDEFLAFLGHELRNPLGPVRNALRVVRLGGSDPSVRLWAEGVVERQVGHMARLVDDLLDVSRIAQGKIQLRREALDLGRLVGTAAEDQRSTLEAAGLRLVVALPAEPVWVGADPTRLSQVVSNLLGNAAKFTDPGGQVSVRLSVDREAGRAAVAVRDTGMGIEPDMLGRVFDAFSQAEESRDRSKGGLGLGLALVKGLVELHGGKVAAASGGRGRGCEFTFWLPLVEPPAPGGKGTDRAGVAAQRRLKILIVEDNEDAALTLRMLLGLYGHEAEMAHNGQAGLEAARRLRPDVVLCDIGLPGMDGYQVARALRAEPSSAKARLIALSGYGSEIEQQRGREAGFDLHLVKPVDVDDLRRVLSEQG